MIQFFSEIFESPTDQARLATTLIAALIAIIVVVVNQWFNSKRARKEKMIEKIEETFTSVIAMQEAMSNLHNEIVTNFKKYNRSKRRLPVRSYGGVATDDNKAHAMNLEVVLLGDKILMLSQLYFPALRSSAELIVENHQEIYNIFTSTDDIGDYLDSFRVHQPIIGEEFDSISKTLTAIMNRSMH